MLLLVRPHRASALLWVGSVLWICGGSAAIALGSSPSALTAPAFADLLPSLPPAVAASLAARGISTPTPIQAAALPRIAAGESVLLHAETGSGKSLAFLLPSLTSLEPGERVLVVSPTRELAVQLANEAMGLLERAGAVQIIAIGATPTIETLLDATLVACTAPEVVALLDADASNALDAFFLSVRFFVRIFCRLVSACRVAWEDSESWVLDASHAPGDFALQRVRLPWCLPRCLPWCLPWCLPRCLPRCLALFWLLLLCVSM